MTLLDALLEVNKAGLGSQQPTDLAVGTVETTNPLSIRLDVSQAPLRSEVLYLTSAVIEKKLSYLGHRHTVGGSTTSEALTAPVCYENGVALPSDSSGVTINRGLAAGDKVLLLSVQRGQKYLVLSRIY